MAIEAVAAVLNMDFGDPTRKLIAIGLANHSNPDGTSAWPAVKKLAAYAGCSTRTVQRHLTAMLEQGWVREGDQSTPAHRGPGQNTIVYDVALNAETAAKWASERTAGVRDIARGAGSQRGGDRLSRGAGGDNLSGAPVTPRCHGARDIAVSPEPSLNRPLNHPSSSLRSDSSSLRSVESTGSRDSGTQVPEAQPALIAAPAPQDGPGTRQDVDSLCNHLAYRIEHNGSKPPTITAGWRKAARLLLDSDRRDLTEAHWLIDWCQDDTFWQSNILSMTKFRQKYDQLRLKARQQVSPEPRRPVVYIDFGAEAANG